MAGKSRTGPQQSSQKTRYRVTNWPEYNRALVERGSVTRWLSDEVIRGWRASGGKGCVYSDLAIRCGLSLRAVFRLTLRQAQGFLASLVSQFLPVLPVRHYSTLCRRSAGLDIRFPARRQGHVHLVIDSTGLKVFGEGALPADCCAIACRVTNGRCASTGFPNAACGAICIWRWMKHRRSPVLS
jgi:hypothetical protein